MSATRFVPLLVASLAPFPAAAQLLSAEPSVRLAAPDALSPRVPRVCADLAVTIDHMTLGRGLMRTMVTVANSGPAPYVGSEGQQWLNVAATAANGATQSHTFGFVALAVGQSRAFSFDRPLSEGPFGTWALVQFAPGTTGDCNSANNSAVATSGH